MRYGLTFAALLLPLAGCVVPPPGPPPYGYPPPGYPMAAPQDFSYPGYAYNDGSPTLVVEGVTWPLIFYGGGWGYWDGYHHWHGAPGPVGGYLSMRHPGGAGYRPWGGGPFGHPQPLGPGGARVGGYPGGGNPYAGRPGGPYPGGGNPYAGHPGGPYHSGGNPYAGRPGGAPPAGGYQRAAAPAGGGRPSASPQRHREDEHH